MQIRYCSWLPFIHDNDIQNIISLALVHPSISSISQCWSPPQENDQNEVTGDWRIPGDGGGDCWWQRWVFSVYLGRNCWRRKQHRLSILHWLRRRCEKNNVVFLNHQIFFSFPHCSSEMFPASLLWSGPTMMTLVSTLLTWRRSSVSARGRGVTHSVLAVEECVWSTLSLTGTGVYFSF